jgi:hypothetical protein
VIIRNVLGEEIDRIPARDLYNQDLHGKQWMHADLSGMSLFGANLEGANLFGARLVRTSLAPTQFLANLCDVHKGFSLMSKMRPLTPFRLWEKAARNRGQKSFPENAH